MCLPLRRRSLSARHKKRGPRQQRIQDPHGVALMLPIVSGWSQKETRRRGCIQCQYKNNLSYRGDEVKLVLAAPIDTSAPGRY